MRVISSAAAAGSRPNLEPSCPVSTWAWVSAVTPGMIRTSTPWVRPLGTIASSRSTSSGPSTTTRPIPFSTAMAISSVLLALPCSTTSDGSTPALSAVRISPPPATSSPRPSSTITRCTAVHGKALDAKTTRDFGQRRASSSAYSLARERSADSATTSTGVPNSAARSSARHPPMVSIPSGSVSLPAGNSSSRSLMSGDLRPGAMPSRPARPSRSSRARPVRSARSRPPRPVRSAPSRPPPRQPRPGPRRPGPGSTARS